MGLFSFNLVCFTIYIVCAFYVIISLRLRMDWSAIVSIFFYFVFIGFRVYITVFSFQNLSNPDLKEGDELKLVLLNFITFLDFNFQILLTISIYHFAYEMR